MFYYRSHNTNFFAAAAAARIAANQSHRVQQTPEFPDIPNQGGHIPPYPNSSIPQGAMAQQMHHIQQIMMKNNNGGSTNSYNRPTQPQAFIR